MSEKEKSTECCKGGEKAKDDSGLGLGVLFFLIGFVVIFLSGWLLFPKLLYSKKEQPFNFNHFEHINDNGADDCESCHFLREDGSFNGIPDLDLCINCHGDINGSTEDEEIFVNEYVKKEKEVPWHVYSRQPDCVFFSHAAHIKGAGMECKTCHGDVGNSTECRPYEENKITGYSRDIWGKNIWGIKKHSWDRMKMDDCAQCHKKETGSKGACFQCHK